MVDHGSETRRTHHIRYEKGDKKEKEGADAMLRFQYNL